MSFACAPNAPPIAPCRVRAAAASQPATAAAVSTSNCVANKGKLSEAGLASLTHLNP